MKELNRITIPTIYPVRSLQWQNDDLVDWVGGGTRFSLDKRIQPANVRYAYRFDRAAILPGGEFVVLYEVLGTKGVILQNGKVLREINRSFYHADVYEYPVALFHLADGTPAIVHCPNEYNELEIDELGTGRRVTKRIGPASDFFHSRLQVSPDGAYLISAGWVWHPIDVVEVFAISEARKEPTCLDQSIMEGPSDDLFDMHSACMGSPHELYYYGNADAENAETRLVLFDLKERKTISTRHLEVIPGTMVAMGSHDILGFHEHPKLIDVDTGKVTASWPDLKTGCQDSSIIRHSETIPPFAVDAQRKRFAVADQSQITVIELG